MILTCPECATRYFAKDGAFGAGPRKVKCATCSHVWIQEPEEAGAAEAEVETDDGDVLTKLRAKTDAPPPKAKSKPKATTAEAVPPGATESEPQPADSSEESFEAAMAKARAARPRNAVADETLLIEEFGSYGSWFSADRIVSIVLALMIFVGVVAAAVQYKVSLTRLWPSLAGVYAAIGLPINATGLELRDSTWEIETRDGMPMLTVRGEIVNTTDIDVAVPRLSFSVRDAAGAELYRWSVVPDVKRLGPGKRSRFTTFLPSPPPDAHDIQIEFATGGA